MLMTEAEVAAKLRCTVSKVKRLRLSGKLGYLPGRPVLIPGAEFAAYIECNTRLALPERPLPNEAKTNQPQREALDAAAALARKKWLERKQKNAQR